MSGLAFALEEYRLAGDSFARALSDFRSAQALRDRGDSTSAALRLRTGRYFAECCAGQLELALRHARAP